MKRLHIQLIAILSGIILILSSIGAYLGAISYAISALATIIIFPAFIISIGLLLSAGLKDGDIPFMGY
ncbi:MAG: hypothetical protein XE11_0942 [Methanomicrobiales archaeon 53_19]|uniref:hypothetical protein n=1 Tax=Methanocalculus sp. TaxID=2004547 RepID=UPI0007490E88|nr:hypothetical protein [Methanocalculus sp.]KUK71094.1 MAG: hypothetical protein XD88_0265 [Methanocalculus sp. 52_23]KUL03948.1 MAG: hypothetical protein XE11_0942 [Methanomicrobiales archaeon 53_19]HIJ06336.1 hypothetical protein [Methanocalculus sp.]